MVNFNRQTIQFITLVFTIIGSVGWSHSSLSDRITAVEAQLSDRITAVEDRLLDRITVIETRLGDIDKRLVVVETSLKASNLYIASTLAQTRNLKQMYEDARESGLPDMFHNPPEAEVKPDS